ncbi:hypothetical protein [Xanthobacter dioxanivorans]|uniref:hypothetical protein n=1 Tax=Xanthobacter dioxanivorans TaxID=2528964 RepID=UPI001E317650|nr:hypothetical protein [Xanthobacter dioxanivorans]
MSETLGAQTYRGFIFSEGKAAQGTFDFLESANNFVNRVLETHPDQIDRVVSGESNEEWMEARLGYPTGKEAFRR